MQGLVNKLNESQESLLQLKENSKLEKQKGQKEIEALEQGLQKLIREHETIKVKRQIKELQGESSYDNVTHHHSQTMSFHSLKTREESLFDVNLSFVFALLNLFFRNILIQLMIYQIIMEVELRCILEYLRMPRRFLKLRMLL